MRTFVIPFYYGSGSTKAKSYGSFGSCLQVCLHFHWCVLWQILCFLNLKLLIFLWKKTISFCKFSTGWSRGRTGTGICTITCLRSSVGFVKDVAKIIRNFSVTFFLYSGPMWRKLTPVTRSPSPRCVAKASVCSVLQATIFDMTSFIITSYIRNQESFNPDANRTFQIIPDQEHAVNLFFVLSRAFSNGRAHNGATMLQDAPNSY